MNISNNYNLMFTSPISKDSETNLRGFFLGAAMLYKLQNSKDITSLIGLVKKQFKQPSYNKDNFEEFIFENIFKRHSKKPVQIKLNSETTPLHEEENINCYKDLKTCMDGGYYALYYNLRVLKIALSVFQDEGLQIKDLDKEIKSTDKVIQQISNYKFQLINEVDEKKIDKPTELNYTIAYSKMINNFIKEIKKSDVICKIFEKVYQDINNKYKTIGSVDIDTTQIYNISKNIEVKNKELIIPKLDTSNLFRMGNIVISPEGTEQLVFHGNNYFFGKNDLLFKGAPVVGLNQFLSTCIRTLYGNDPHGLESIIKEFLTYQGSLENTIEYFAEKIVKIGTKMKEVDENFSKSNTFRSNVIAYFNEMDRLDSLLKEQPTFNKWVKIALDKGDTEKLSAYMKKHPEIFADFLTVINRRTKFEALLKKYPKILQIIHYLSFNSISSVAIEVNQSFSSDRTLSCMKSSSVTHNITHIPGDKTINHSWCYSIQKSPQTNVFASSVTKPQFGFEEPNHHPLPNTIESFKSQKVAWESSFELARFWINAKFSFDAPSESGVVVPKQTITVDHIELSPWTTDSERKQIESCLKKLLGVTNKN